MRGGMWHYASLLLALLAGQAAADELHFKSGEVIKGKIVKETEVEVRIRLKRASIEAEMSFKKADILKIVRETDIDKEYQAELERTDKTSGVSLFHLAEWCLERRLAEQAREHAIAAAEIEGLAQNKARALLAEMGYIEFEGEWLPKDEALARQGKVERGGRIISEGQAEVEKETSRASVQRNKARGEVAKWQKYLQSTEKKIDRLARELAGNRNDLERFVAAWALNEPKVEASADRVVVLKAQLDRALATAAYERREYGRTTEATDEWVKTSKSSLAREERRLRGLRSEQSKLAKKARKARADRDQTSRELARESKDLEKFDSNLAEAEAELARAEQRLAIAEAEEAKEASTEPDTALTRALRRSVVLVMADKGDVMGFGTAFVVSSKGHFVTNHHVIDGSTSLTAHWDTSSKRSPVLLEVVAFSAEDDLALLRAVDVSSSHSFSPLTLSTTYTISAPVLSVGFPLPARTARELKTDIRDIVVSKGILSSIRHGEDQRPRYLQTDADTAQGCSGGPLVNEEDGAVLGVVSSGLDPRDNDSRGNVMTFAIPATKIREHFARYLDED